MATKQPPRYRHREANWGPPADREIRDGSHLVLEIALAHRDRLVGLLLRRGIHGADPDVLYFPHDLIRVGETVEGCVRRIVRAAARVGVRRVTHLALEAWLDEEGHWHVCHNVIAHVDRLPRPGGNVRKVFAFRGDEPPAIPFGWWKPKDLRALWKEHLAK
jgi:hypothetical protein